MVLVVPFVSVAFVVGARAVAGAVSAQDDLLLLALALGWAAVSVLKNTSRRQEASRREVALRIASSHRRTPRGAFIGVSST
jgi:predicted RNA-binding protein with EMAP domain